MTTERHKAKPFKAAIDDGAVLDAARECVIAVGWRRTTLTDVARRAGISRMSIYRKWSDMQTLMADVMAREWSGLAGVHLLAARDTAALSPHSVSSAVVEVARAIRGNLLFQKVVDVDPELLVPYILHRRGRAQNSLLTALETALTSGQDAERLRSGNAAVMARTILTAMQGYVFSAATMTDAVSGHQPSPHELAEHELAEQFKQLIERYLTP